MKNFVFVGFGCCLWFCEHAFAEDWPNWRGPRFDGGSNEKIPERLPESLPVLWKAKVGTGFSSFAVVGDRVLTMGNREDKDTVWCLDARSGVVNWQHTYDCPLDPLYYEGGPGGTPTVDKGSVYTLSKKGHAFRLDLESGAVVWSRDLVADHDLKLPEWSFAGSAFVYHDRVLFNAGRGGIALSTETGETLWLPENETSGYASFVPFSPDEGDSGLLHFSAESISLIDSATGERRWSFPWKTGRDVNAADPVVVGNDFILSSASGTKRLRPPGVGAGVETVWEQKDLKWYFNPGVLIEKNVYSLHGTTHRPTELVCTDVATGETVWSEEGYGSGGLVAARNRVIVFDLGKLTIFSADPKGFRPDFQQVILEGKCWTAPVIANGRIYVRNADGDVAVVEVGSAQARH